MQVVIRADASTAVGSGHVMRCLTLADALRRRGAVCHFLCREDAGHLLDLVRQRGHRAHPLTEGTNRSPFDWSVDAERTQALLSSLGHPDWLIVDHYRLGREWECNVAAAGARLCAVDDLGRPHECDLLLDQNFRNSIHARYQIPVRCERLLGSEYALVRPEFAQLRAAALARRDGSLRHLLVSMGGSDPQDETSKALFGVAAAGGADWAVDVVIGASNPNRDSVEAACTRLPRATLHVQTSRMAQLMLAADCALGASGSTSWERCCLGLPSLVAVMSEDQAAIAESLATAGAHILLGLGSVLAPQDYATALRRLTEARLRELSRAAAQICDGHGAERVADRFFASREHHA